MTILNDKDIRKLCLLPTHVFKDEQLYRSTAYTHRDGCYYSLADGRRSRFENASFLRELTESEIAEFAKDHSVMITPFNEKLSEAGVISHGLSSFGYDATCGNKFKIATNDPSVIIDPKNIDARVFEDFEGDVCIIPPHGFALTYTNETFDIPRDLMSLCFAKSTYARCGLVVGVTPLEPGWRGQVTIELSNTTDLPIKVYANEGICQFIFIKGSSAVETAYNMRGGKYMNQEGIVLPKVLSA